jgi:hypothetical protein
MNTCALPIVERWWVMRATPQFHDALNQIQSRQPSGSRSAQGFPGADLLRMVDCLKAQLVFQACLMGG